MHCLYLLFNRRDQLELSTASVEVLSGSVHLVIRVAAEVIGKKADALLESDHFSGADQVLLLSRGQEATGRAQVTAHQRLKQIELHCHPGQISLVFPRR